MYNLPNFLNLLFLRKNNRFALVIISLFFLATSLQAQQQDTIPSPKVSNTKFGSLSGKVIDKMSQEEIIGATIKILGTKYGAVSRINGRFKVDLLPAGSYRLRISANGYVPLEKTDVVVSPGRPIDLVVELMQTSVKGEDVIVTANPYEKNIDNITSTLNYSSEEVRRLPGGFEDVVRAISIAPGVAQAQNGRNDLLVRGGAPSENLYLINNIESPNINHFGTQGAGGGPLSFVNLDFVRDVSFSTGGFGVKYGDKTSSVLTLDLRDGRNDGLGGKATISASQFGLNLEGPAGGNGDFLFSARRSYLDFIFRAAGLSFIPTYWDFLGKVHYTLSKNDELTAIGIGVVDYIVQLNRTDSDRINNSQILNNTQYQSLAGVTWKHLWGSGFLVTTLGETSVDYRFKQVNVLEEPIFINNSIEQEINLRSDATFLFSGGSEMTFGGQAKTIHFTTDLSLKQPADSLSLSLADRFYKYALYSQYSSVLFSSLRLNLGGRLDYFSGIATKFYPSLRGALSYSLMNDLTLNASGGRYYQSPSYIWLVANPDNRNLNDIKTDVFVLGIDKFFGDGVKLTAEAYLKNYSDYPASLSRQYLILANTGTGFGGEQDGFSSFGLEPLASRGKGIARGIELSMQKKFSQIPCYGTVALSFNQSRFTAIDGIERPSNFDQTVILNISGGYKFNELWEAGMKFRFATGRPYTPINAVSGDPSFGYQNVSQYNALRLTPSHALDIRVDKRWLFDTWTLISYIDIQNIYNRKNPDAPVFNTATRAIEVQTQLGILPSIGISAEF